MNNYDFLKNEIQRLSDYVNLHVRVYGKKDMNQAWRNRMVNLVVKIDKLQKELHNYETVRN